MLGGLTCLAVLPRETVTADARLPFTSADVRRIQSVLDLQASPAGGTVAYTIQLRDRPGRPSTQLWMLDLASKKPSKFEGLTGAGGARWSPDGHWLALFGQDGSRSGLFIAHPDGSDLRFVAPIVATNHPLPSSGERVAWSTDSRRIAFISATPGLDRDANSDPMVITRYLYKPTASEGLTRFDDNRRTHVFVADLSGGTVRQLTNGDYYEHSIDWSPTSDQILFVSNRSSDPDRFFNYDLFTVSARDGSVRRLTNTKSAEYRPRWSRDGRSVAFQGTTRDLTSSETTMEDTHAWVMNMDGSGRREIGKPIDDRQGAVTWSSDGRALYCAVQERGNNTLYRVPVDGDRPTARSLAGSVGAWSLAGSDRLVYAATTPDSPSELFTSSVSSTKPDTVQLTALNAPLLRGKHVAPVRSFTFDSFDGTPVEAFLTEPDHSDARRHPMIVMMHGGPHGQQGPSFDHKAQVYAAQGWAVLMVNYRGSTGYGQKFVDAIFGDQDGGEAKDVLAGVDAALRTFPWIDPNRLGLEGGSYGGQLTNWIITQTDRFKAAVPSAGISNLVSFNYTAYYHDYLAVEYGAFPHEHGIMDKLWQRSPIRFAGNVRTPTMFIHGENDNDVPIAEAEQFYIALKDVGVETVMVRYPREGHGLREMNHVIDALDRSIEWYRSHFQSTSGSH
jgi:dipeptidyl aminopeptidase/acylaminoacyl peptidase